MPKGESTYYIAEFDFPNDPRLKKWPEMAKFGYICGWWAYAVKVRRECIPQHLLDEKTVSSCTGVSLKSLRSALACALSSPHLPLMERLPDGGLRVCGVRRKHGNLKNWNDEADDEQKGCLRASERSGAERNGERAEMSPQTPPKPKAKNALGTLAESGERNPLTLWLKHRGEEFTQADRRFIERLWDDFADVEICLAMVKAIEKGGNLGLVEKILKDEKARQAETHIFTPSVT